MYKKFRLLHMIMYAVSISVFSSCGFSALLGTDSDDSPSPITMAFAALAGTTGGSAGTRTSQFISASAGGTVYLGDELSLSIPPGSLEKDTTITIEKIESSPDGDADGFSRFGQAYRFGPPGTSFAPDRPAVLNMKYDGAAAQAKGLDVSRMRMYYFDEGMGRYVNVANAQDRFSGTLTARIEHFTIYLPVAMAATATNGSSIVMAQNPVPNVIRAGAPVYFRYTIHDQDPANGGGYNGGSVASAELCVTKIVSAAQTCVPLRPEKILDPTYSNVVTEDTWGALLDTTFWSAVPGADIDGTPAADLAFEVRVTDNLNNVVTMNPPSLNVDRLYDAGTTTIAFNSPSTRPVTSGFSRTLRVRARDTLGAFFNMIPNAGDVNVTNQIGVVQIQESTGTILFTAEKRDVGNIAAFFGPASALTAITVTNGPIDRIEILDTNGMPFTGALAADGLSNYAFDVLGYDAFGNFTQVQPTWSADPGAGVIGATSGVLSVANNTTTAQVTATLGTHVDTQSVAISPRYRVGGTGTGISGNVILTNGGDSVVVSANGAYQFPLLHPDGTTYDVVVQSQPTNLACHVNSASGAIAGADVVSANIDCLALFAGRVDTAPGLTDIAAITAGDGIAGHVDDAGLFARFNRPSGITSDGRFLYVADRDNHVIRRVHITTGQVVTIAGQPGVAGHGDGVGAAVFFNRPTMLTTDGTNLYVTDESNHVIRKIVIATGVTSTFAGQAGVFSPFQNGAGASATFRFPAGITMDGTHLYVSELGNHVIRRIEIATGNVSTLAGVVGASGSVDGGPAVAEFNEPFGLDTDGTFLYVAEFQGHRVRRVDIATGNVTTIAGNGTAGDIDNPVGTMASLNFPTGVLIQGGTLYVTTSNVIRTVNLGTTEVLIYGGIPGAAGSTNGPVLGALFNGTYQLTTDGNAIFIADLGANRIRRID